MKAYIITLLFLFSVQLNAQYTINDTFADPTQCTAMTSDIFVVWWDNDFDYSAEVAVLLDQMIAYRTICLNDLNMQDPPNVDDGYYYNVYLHGDGGYFDVYGWGNGQGTDSNGYPYLTLPYWIISDLTNTAHETFHIFQYSANSPGFAYSGDSQWYIEASANWFSGTQNLTNERAFIEAESLVRLPHVPLWLSYDNFPASYPQNWQRYVHQYAMALFLFYLTEEEAVPTNLITEGFFVGTTELPQEYLFNNIGATTFRDYFINWAAHMTNEFDFITPEQRAANLLEWNNYADANDENEFTEIFDETGSNGWYRPISSETTNGWSFNTYKLENNSNTNYTFEINGDTTGSFNDPSFFQGEIVVKNSNGTTTFYDVPMINDWQGSLAIEVTNTDTEIYFIIASMPEIFEDENPEFQLFSYEMSITNSLLSTPDFNASDFVSIYPNPIINSLHIDLEKDQINIDVELYSALGQRLLRQNFQNEKNIEMDLSNVNSGIYFLKVSSDIKSKTVKLIKQ